MADTALLFLSDTFQFEASSTVTSCGEDDGGPYVVTGATVFYPGGGGQEPDKGMIINAAGEYPVLKAVLHGRQMRHYIHERIATGEQVTIRIDAEHRMQNARLHTAGHLLSSVVYEKLQWPLLPVKGFHYQQGAYVEFERADPEGEFCLERLQEALSEEISRGLAVSAAFVAEDDEAFGHAVKPQGFVVPAGRRLRIVRIDPYRACPCGGTHLDNTGQLQWIRITHLRHKKGNIRISYEAG